MQFKNLLSKYMESLYIYIMERQNRNANDWVFMAQKLKRQIIQWVSVNWNNSVGGPVKWLS